MEKVWLNVPLRKTGKVHGSLNGEHYGTVVCKLMVICGFSTIFLTEYDVTTVSADKLHFLEHGIISLTVK
jgi:hypothetical protein